MPAAIGAVLTGGGFLSNLLVTTALTAASIGLSRLNAPESQPVGSAAIKPSDGQSEIRQPLPPREKSYGRVRKSGPVFWYESVRVQDAGGILTKGIVLNHGRISGIVQYHIDDRDVGDTNGELTPSPLFTAIGIKFGAASQTPWNFENGFPEMRADGVATAVLYAQNSTSVAEHQNMYPGGEPKFTVTFDASVCFDPRDEAHNREDPTTWEASENSAVVILNYLIDADGYGIGWERIEPNLAEWVAAMDVCDAAVELASGGTEARYRLGGTFTLVDRPVDVMNRMLATCDGYIWQKRDGSIGISVGRFEEPDLVITDKHIVALDLERGQDRLTAIGGLRATYTAPAFDYVEREAEPWPDGETVLAAGDRVAELDLLWVPSHAQARRLMKRDFIRRNAGWRGTISTNLFGRKARDKRFVRVRSSELGLDEVFQIGRYSLDLGEDPGVTMEVVSVGAEIDDWDPATEEMPDDGEGSFDIAGDIYQKTGATSIDPISEAGGVAGQTAVVTCANSGNIASTPSGWTEICRQSNGSLNLGYAAFLRKLDGTEGSTTFLSSNGIIHVALFDGADAPFTEGVMARPISANVPTLVSQSNLEQPCAVIGIGATRSTITSGDHLVFKKGPDDSDLNPKIAFGNSGTPSLTTKIATYTYTDIPYDIDINMGDEGAANGLASFVLKPGT